MEHGNGRSAEYLCEEMLKAGIRIIQYREKYRPAHIQLEECRRLRLLTREYNACFIINDHAETAQIIDADGLHIGQDDLSVSDARDIVGPDRIIGLSTHSPEQGLKAVRDGADYIGAGPVFSTNTKTNVCAPVGIEYVKFAKENITIPWVAIGGIKQHNIQQVKNAGATCICLVTEITMADDIQSTIRSLKNFF